MSDGKVESQTAQEVVETQSPEFLRPAADQPSSNAARVIRYMSDDDARRAADKVFRLHARLFEELAK